MLLLSLVKEKSLFVQFETGTSPVSLPATGTDVCSVTVSVKEKNQFGLMLLLNSVHRKWKKMNNQSLDK